MENHSLIPNLTAGLAHRTGVFSVTTSTVSPSEAKETISLPLNNFTTLRFGLRLLITGEGRF